MGWDHVLCKEVAYNLFHLIVLFASFPNKTIWKENPSTISGTNLAKSFFLLHNQGPSSTSTCIFDRILQNLDKQQNSNYILSSGCLSSKLHYTGVLRTIAADGSAPHLSDQSRPGFLLANGIVTGSDPAFSLFYTLQYNLTDLKITISPRKGV